MQHCSVVVRERKKGEENGKERRAAQTVSCKNGVKNVARARQRGEIRDARSIHAIKRLGPRFHVFPRDPGKDAVQGPQKLSEELERSEEF